MIYNKDIHIGKLIMQKCSEQNLSYTQFAKAINTSRTNVYAICKSKSIDTDRLVQISNVLDYPFFEEYLLQTTSNINTQMHTKITKKEQCLKQVEKYLEIV